jgi:hypothetical protein
MLVPEDLGFLASLGEWFPVFKRIVLPSSLRSDSPGLLDPEDGGTNEPSDAGVTYPVTQRHIPRRPESSATCCKNFEFGMLVPVCH